MKLRGLAASVTVLAAITVGASGCSEADVAARRQQVAWQRPFDEVHVEE